MKITGQILKENRDAKGLSLAEISIATKISQKTLKAIEEGNLNDLPAKTFLRGFVQSYANYLKIDVEQVLNTFQEEMGSTIPSEQVIEGPEPSRSPELELKGRSNFRRILMFVFIGFLVIFIVVIKQIVDRYEAESVIDNKIENIQSIGETSEEDKKHEPSVLATQNVIKASDEDTNNEQDIKPEPQEKVDVVEPEKEPEPEVKVKVEAEAEAESPPEIKQEVVEKKKAIDLRQELIIEALDSVKLKFQIDNGPTQKLSLDPDQVHTFKANSKIKIEISDGGVVNIIQNGRDKGVPGELGEPITLNYSK